MSEVADRIEWLELLPRGLCAVRNWHEGHEHGSATLGVFWCTGDPDDREPQRSERRRTSQIS